ncbi:hypothetical protein E2C01_000095 [Portunus trituberculatus]|uniref:Uncharacterized protein n=1 Tax=Portunus trituberculatus TaxID=210409 RepID=A0A5B7CIQ9_PORTR|nr:hypothetical protein [Portunus trituberculatus]
MWCSCGCGSYNTAVKSGCSFWLKRSERTKGSERDEADGGAAAGISGAVGAGGVRRQRRESGKVGRYSCSPTLFSITQKIHSNQQPGGSRAAPLDRGNWQDRPPPPRYLNKAGIPPQ